MIDQKRIKNYADRNIPDTFFFVDEDGKELADMPPMPVGDREKLMIAELCIRQKQSPDVILLRALRQFARKRR